MLVDHTEPDETVKFYILPIIDVLKSQPNLLDFCKACENKGKLQAERMLELIDYLGDIGTE